MNKWKKRLCCGLTAALLTLSMITPSMASDSEMEKYPDLDESHWAYEDMDRAVILGVINGVGGGCLAPEQELTWGQFLTMVSRTFGGDRYDRHVRAGLRWDRAGYQTAVDLGLLPKGDFLPVTSDSLAVPISRRDVAVLLDRVLPAEAEQVDQEILNIFAPYRNTQPIESGLKDWSGLPGGYRESVERLYRLNIIRGNESGRFNGGQILRRADGTALLMRVLTRLDLSRMQEEKSITVSFEDRSGDPIGKPVKVSTMVGSSLSWETEAVLPKDFTSVDPESFGPNFISSACDDYTLVLRRMSTQEQGLTDRWQKGEIGDKEYNLRRMGDTKEKRLLLFGTTKRNRYSSRREAEQHMVTVTFPMWKLRNGKKVASQGSFLIQENIAADVKEIFTEIFNDPEQFPIKEAAGYGWRGDRAKGEHNCGTAIDINWQQNYQVKNGRAMCGDHWKPGEDPYSMPVNGSVVRIFAEHGWTWGGNGWSADADPSRGYHDYMHFSYMGR